MTAGRTTAIVAAAMLLGAACIAVLWCPASLAGATTAAKPSTKPSAAAKAPATKSPAKRPPVATGPAIPLVPAPADSLARPSFAGRWKLSLTRSSFGIIPGGKPTSRTDVIEQDGTRLKQTLYLVLGSKPDTTVYVYAMDGTPTVNKVAQRDIRSAVNWEGSTLHLASTAKLLVLDTSLDDRWVLAPGGRELVYQRHVKFGFGEGDQTLIFERE